MIDLKSRDMEEIEILFEDLKAQLRHMKVKYDLMIREEIELLYATNNKSIIVCEEQIKHMMRRE